MASGKKASGVVVVGAIKGAVNWGLDTLMRHVIPDLKSGNKVRDVAAAALAKHGASLSPACREELMITGLTQLCGVYLTHEERKQRFRMTKAQEEARQKVLDQENELRKERLRQGTEVFEKAGRTFSKEKDAETAVYRAAEVDPVKLPDHEFKSRMKKAAEDWKKGSDKKAEKDQVSGTIIDTLAKYKAQELMETFLAKTYMSESRNAEISLAEFNYEDSVARRDWYKSTKEGHAKREEYFELQAHLLEQYINKTGNEKATVRDLPLADKKRLCVLHEESIAGDAGVAGKLKDLPATP